MKHRIILELNNFYTAYHKTKLEQSKRLYENRRKISTKIFFAGKGLKYDVNIRDVTKH